MVGKIKIEGVVGHPSSEEEAGVQLIDVITQVKKQPDATSFRVTINSPGGMVDEGFAIYNYIRSLGVPITTVGKGIVASIATVIFMAGTKRVIKDGTKFMVHLPMGGTRGTADELLAYTKMIKKVEKRVIRFYSENFGMPAEAIEPLLKNETWLTSEQLHDLGIITTEAIGVAAIATLPDTKNNNQKSKTMSTNKDEGVTLEKIWNILKGHKPAENQADPVENKFLLTADLKKLEFPDVAAEGVVAVNNTATLEGNAPNGDVLLQDGRTMKFENGVLKAIIEKEEDQEIAAIRQELATAKADLAIATAAKASLEAEKVVLKAQLAQQEGVINMIKALETGAGTLDQRGNENNQQQPPAQPSRFEAAMAKLKN